MRTLVLLLTFLAELLAWGGLGWAAYRLAGGGSSGTFAAVAAVLVVLTAWGRYASPRAEVSPRTRTIVQIAVYAAAVAGLLAVGATWWALAVTVVAIAAAAGVRHTEPNEIG